MRFCLGVSMFVRVVSVRTATVVELAKESGGDGEALLQEFSSMVRDELARGRVSRQTSQLSVLTGM